MDIYALLEVAAIVLGVVAALGSIAFCTSIWLFSRATHITHIEPIVCDRPLHNHTTKWENIKINVEV